MAAKLLDLKRVLGAADSKDYDFYDNLSPDDKKAFSAYLTLRWMASVGGNADLQSYYLLATNEQVNKHFWDVSKHPKLCWLSIAAASPGVGKQYHQWIAMKKKGSNSKLRKEVASHFPAMKEDEIDMVLTINTEEEIAAWLLEHGMENKEVKALL